MLCRVLGPLEVRRGERWTAVGAPKLRALLAALAAEPGRVVSTEHLIGELWADDPPSGARKLVGGYVLRLRRLMADPEGEVLVTQAPGYRLAAAPGDVDAGRFEELVADGRRALDDGDHDKAAGVLAEAMGLWRGTALAGVPRGPLAAAEADRLEELRLAATELRIEAGVRQGKAAGLVPELRRLTAAYPLRERFWYQLMRVLADGGRPAEALAAYARAGEVLADELGVDPGPDLRGLHQAILAGDSPASAGPLRPGPVAAPAIPRQLPGAVGHFTGREAELRRLSRFLEGDSAAGNAVLISAIDGTAGVGKTALAVHWAHQVADRFPDGQLYVDLRGYDPGQPVSPADALAGFLRALGVPGQEIPAEAAEQAARYRSLLAGRRVLVLLDNASDVEQVRPLLPGTPTCLTVVTSRDTLAGLVARDGAWRLDLDLLPLAAAAGLLRSLIGGRAAAEPAATRTLAVQCCRLPLALRVAAELAAARPASRLADLVAELADQQRRLDLLAAGDDPRTAVRAVFSWSSRHLDAAAARTFRLLGLHPGPGLDGYAAAALTGATIGQASHALDVLARAHLIYATGPGRYGLHDLLRAYAAGQAARENEAERRAALTRLLDFYLHTAAAAMDALYPAERHRRPRVAGPPGPAPPVAAPAAARAWLDTERPGLVAAVTHAAAHGWPRHATGLAATVFRHLEVGGHYPEIRVVYDRARQAAREAGDLASEAAAVHYLSMVDLHQGRYRQATGRMRQALGLWQQAGEATGQARVLANLGIVGLQQGRYRPAAASLRQALDLYREVGDAFGEGRALNTLGLIELHRGRYPQAAGCFDQALALHRQVGDAANETACLANLGVVHLRQGEYDQAAGRLGEALELSRRIGMPLNEAYSLTNLGVLDLLLGRHQQAINRFRQALALSRQLGERSSEAEARNGLGAALLAAGRSGDARSQHATALSLAIRMGEVYEQARAHDGLAAACQAAGDAGSARRHRQEAGALYARLGASAAARIRAWAAPAGKPELPQLRRA